MDMRDLYDYIERQENKRILNSIAMPSQGTTETYKVEYQKNKGNSDDKG